MYKMVVSIVALLWACTAEAQITKLPNDVQKTLADVGPIWQKDIRSAIDKTLQAYTPLLKNSPKAGIKVTRDVSYGPAALNKLDIYQPEGKTGVPILVFIHGGAYVRGERNNGEVFGNVTTWFARQGMLGINADYRLAPASKFPSGPEDMKMLVAWVKANAPKYGGDPQRIYLMGHSAGATHIANYAYDRSYHPAGGPGIAGMILMSGRYNVHPFKNDPNYANVQAYFGMTEKEWAEHSAINFVKKAPPIPTFIIVAEYDNPDLDTQGALLFAALCERDRACPRFRRMEQQNHMSIAYGFNTPDEEMGREILDFMKRGR